MPKYFAFIMLSLSLAACAKELRFDRNVNNTTLLNPNCPLTFTGIYADEGTAKRDRVSVHFVNQADKSIIAAKFAFEGLDALWETHEFSREYALAVNLRVRREARPVWSMKAEDLEQDTAGGIKVYLVRVMFADGSFWQDDGKKSCSLGISGRAKPKRENTE